MDNSCGNSLILRRKICQVAIVLNCFMVLAQYFILKGQLGWCQLIQIPLVLLFGFFYRLSPISHCSIGAHLLYCSAGNCTTELRNTCNRCLLSSTLGRFLSSCRRSCSSHQKGLWWSFWTPQSDGRWFYGIDCNYIWAAIPRRSGCCARGDGTIGFACRYYNRRYRTICAAKSG